MLANEFVPRQFQGKDRFKCRTATLDELTTAELLRETRDYSHGVAQCERCNTVIEPYLSDQWYLNMKELAEPAITAVEEDRIVFIPDRYAATYLDWMQNMRDWNISRQLWWGHRIPIWTCSNGHVQAYENPPEKCSKCDSKELRQDDDVLDTWFSSALWPFATLGLPEKTRGIQRVLSDHGSFHCSRNHQFVGFAHDLHELEVHQNDPVQACLDPSGYSNHRRKAHV